MSFSPSPTDATDILNITLEAATTNSTGNKENHHFVNQTDLDAADIVCVVLTMLMFAGYQAVYWHTNRKYHYKSVSSHLDFHRVQWIRHIFSAQKHRMNVIQCFRSSLMVVSFYIDVTLAGVASVAGPIFGQWKTVAVVRSVVPMFFLFFALINYFITSMAYYYLHFHTQVEEGAGGTDLTRDRSATYTKILGDHSPATVRGSTSNFEQIMDPQQMKVNKQRSAAMVLQCQTHFRLGWRSMLMGIVTILWVMSPYAMLVASVGLVLHMYYMDFPFTSEFQHHMLGRGGVSAVGGVASPSTAPMEPNFALPPPATFTGNGADPQPSAVSQDSFIRERAKQGSGQYTQLGPDGSNNITSVNKASPLPPPQLQNPTASDSLSEPPLVRRDTDVAFSASPTSPANPGSPLGNNSSDLGGPPPMRQNTSIPSSVATTMDGDTPQGNHPIPPPSDGGGGFRSQSLSSVDVRQAISPLSS